MEEILLDDFIPNAKQNQVGLVNMEEFEDDF